MPLYFYTSVSLWSVLHYVFSEPVDEDNYIFDTSLLDGYCSPRVDASKLSINNLTYDRLVAELAEVEQRLEECNKEQSEKVSA